MNYPEPVYPTWGRSLGQGLSGGMDSVMQGILRRRAAAQQALAFRAQTGYDPNELLQGQALANQAQGVGQNIIPINPAMAAPSPSYSNYGPIPPGIQQPLPQPSGPTSIFVVQVPRGGVQPTQQNVDLVSQFHAWNAEKQQARQMEAEQTRLGVQKAGFENKLLAKRLSGDNDKPLMYKDPNTGTLFYGERGAYGNINWQQAREDNMLGGAAKITPTDIPELVGLMKQGNPASIILGGMGQAKGAVNAAYSREMKKNPRLMSPLQLETGFQAEKRRAVTLNSQQTQGELVAVDQFNQALDIVRDGIKEMGNSNFVPLNVLNQRLATGFYAGSKYATTVASVKAAVSEIAMQGSRVFSGTAATDIRFKQELERFNSAQSMDQILRVADVLSQIANSRKNGILNMPVNYAPNSQSKNPQLRYDDLLKQGLPEDQIYKTLAQEGF